MSLTTRTDVTAVKFYKNLILAGIGSYISVFNKQTTKLLQRIKCLNGQKIHGFVLSKCGARMLVFGGKQFTEILMKDSNELLIGHCLNPVLCDDWIHAAIWNNKDEIVILTAHNVVQYWNMSNQTMLSQHVSLANSILYSGFLLPMQDDLIIFSGTVYSEVIVQRCGDDIALHRLRGHRGVIFSINCDLQKDIIVTTSDDRSVRIWALKNPENIPKSSKEFWNKIQIECNHEVYGHVARVMRNFITSEFIVSCGEDASICFWTIDGKLVRKVVSHQTSTVWAIDGNEDHLVTGGGDSGIILHPLTVATDYYEQDELNVDGTIKKVQFTARNNIVLVNADELIYYDVKSKSKVTYKLLHESTYKMLSLSSCKQLIAVADMMGNLKVYAEHCKEDAYLQMVVDTKINIDRLMSLHWAGNRLLVACSDDGDITVLAAKGIETEIYFKFKLPSCRERYITAATINPTNNVIICGDRSGNVHCFVKGQVDPGRTFKNVHGSYGPTSITVKDDIIITTGRLGNITYHSLKDNLKESKYLTEKSVECQWIEKFLDKNENIVCGFQEKKFVVYNVTNNTKILEVPCGGGHRPWDAIRYFEQVDNNFEEFIRLIYVKNNNVYLVTAQLSKIVPKAIVNGSHSKIIHCLETYRNNLNNTTFYISGGEDTTMRISSMKADFEFKDEYVYKHLSNIRCLKIFPMKDNQLLVMSAGGRAQLCINMFKFEVNDGKTNISCEEIVNFMLKGDDEQRKRMRKGDQEYDFNPETRMMDIDAMKINEDKFLIFIGCSDTILRIYTLDKTASDIKFKEIDHHTTCILKTVFIQFQDKDLIVTATTRGEMAFWNIINNENELDIVSFENTLNINNSGTNCFDYKLVKDKLVIAMGGDNNSISMLLLAMELPNLETEKYKMKIVNQVEMDHFHCSQITGMVLLDGIMISTSIDQRVTVCEWRVVEDNIKCIFLRQCYTDVADVAGMNLLEYSSDSATVCVFGKGFEVLKLDITQSKKENTD